MSTIHLGIDCGLDGAIAVRHDKGYTDVFNIPVIEGVVSGKKRLDYDRRGLQETLEKLAVQGAVAVVERQWARPGQGATAGFKLGQGYEIWLSALTFFKIPYLVVTPATWKKALGLPGQEKSEDRKTHSIEMALKLFPSVDISRPGKYTGKKLTKKYHDGKAEALLLTEYLRREG